MVVILLNFNIVGEMDIKAGSSEQGTTQSKPIQNENIEPNKSSVEVKNPSMSAKSFFNKEAAAAKQETQPAGKLNQTSTSNNQPGMFNGLKICGIDKLNPYQNK